MCSSSIRYKTVVPCLRVGQDAQHLDGEGDDIVDLFRGGRYACIHTQILRQTLTEREPAWASWRRSSNTVARWATPIAEVTTELATLTEAARTARGLRTAYRVAVVSTTRTG